MGYISDGRDILQEILNGKDDAYFVHLLHVECEKRINETMAINNKKNSLLLAYNLLSAVLLHSFQDLSPNEFERTYLDKRFINIGVALRKNNFFRVTDCLQYCRC